MMRPRSTVPAALLAVVLAVATPASAALAMPAGAASPAAPGSGPVSIAVVMPLTVPPTTTGLLDADALATYTADEGLLDRQLDAVIGTDAAIGLDPMIPVSIRVLGTSAPASSLEFLERLRTASNEVFLLGYADADPALAVLAGTTSQLDPLGFGFAIDPASFGPAQTAPPTPTPDPTSTSVPTADPTTPPDDGGPPPLPSTEDLLSWSTTLPAIAWPAEGTLTADGLAGLPGLGYDDVLVSGANVSATSTALVDLGDIDGLVADVDLTAAVRDAVYAVDETSYQAASVTLDAALRAEAITAPGRTLIATLDRRWPFGSLRLDRVLSVIELSASAETVPLSQVLAGTKGTATLVAPPGEDDLERAATLGELASAARAESSYLRIAADPAAITEPRRLAQLGLAAVGWRTDPVGWGAATDKALAAARATLDAVQIVEGSDQLLLSDISSLRLQVSNALPVAVTVSVEVRPLRPLLHVEDTSVEVTIEPDSTATAAVPVEAIINGDVTVRAELRGSGGLEVGSPRLLKVIVQAGWETAGTLIVGALIVLIFGGGLVRAVLRRRREAAADADGGDSGDGTADAPDSPDSDD